MGVKDILHPAIACLAGFWARAGQMLGLHIAQLSGSPPCPPLGTWFGPTFGCQQQEFSLTPRRAFMWTISWFRRRDKAEAGAFQLWAAASVSPGCLRLWLPHISGFPDWSRSTLDFLQRAEAPIGEVIFLLRFLAHG